MKIGIDIGHNVPFDTGNISLLDENVCNLEVGTRVIHLLENLGYEVINCTPTTATSIKDSISQRTNTANINKCDYFISIHFKKGGLSGCEVILYKDTLVNTANRVCANISNSLSVKNRGVKYKQELPELIYATMPSMMVQCLYIDNMIDKQAYNPDKIAIAIVEGLTQKDISTGETKTCTIASDILPVQEYNISMYAFIHKIKDVVAKGKNSCVIGTIGQDLSIEGIAINIDGINLHYDVHMQNKGEQEGTVAGEILGSRNANLRLEGITLYVDNIAQNYKLNYRAYLRGSGWTDWKNSGEFAGTRGESRPMDAIEILIEKQIVDNLAKIETLKE